MLTFAQGSLFSLDAARLEFVFYGEHGVLSEPWAIGFEVFDASNDDKALAPVSVAVGVIDLDADAVVLGRYAARFALPTGNVYGRHFIRWTWRATESSAPQSYDAPFDVQPFAIGSSTYATISDLRAEGINAKMLSDARAVMLLKRATTFIERVTGRFFEPRYATLYVDGKATATVLVDQPIIALESLAFAAGPIRPTDFTISNEDFRVYNRHLRGQLQPDDRDNPRLEMFRWDIEGPWGFSNLVFPRGQQNIAVRGWFGYTDPDGSFLGKTPDDIVLATMLLVQRDQAKLGGAGGAFADGRLRGRIISETTRDQSYTLAAPNTYGLSTNITGDPTIDQLLLPFVKPPTMGAA